jgi:MFS family permease
MTTQYSSPFSIRNIRLFIAFRIFFNARFYYPVFTIIFLDFGLSVEQFAILNSVWAITIVLAEVPSGALADIIGRKKLVLSTSVIMAFELGLISFVPLGNMHLIFWVFLINRILSGLAEAMASGADEAIAYDSLVEYGDKKDWPKVLSLLMRISSAASIITGITGALLYDPDIVNKVVHYAGTDLHFTQQQTMRIPLVLTFVLSLLAVSTASMMSETNIQHHDNEGDCRKTYSLREALGKTFEAGRWIVQTPFALSIILLGMMFDHVIRMMVTLTSQYYRLIDIPEAVFGFIGAGISMLGLLVPKIAEKMVASFSPAANMAFLGALCFTGFLGITFFIPYLGVIPMAMIFVAIMMTSFFTSSYLNQITSSHHRATVLSFKGMAFNLAYGAIGIGFAQLMQTLRHNIQISSPDITETILENNAFKEAVSWFPWYSIAGIIVIAVLCKYLLRNSDIQFTLKNKPQ